jgi:predicted nucleic acid-binding protein
MAAIEHPFHQVDLPVSMAIDADFVVSVIVESEPFHAPCVSFSARLLQASINIVHSPLLRLEFLHAWQKAVNRGAVPMNLVAQRTLWDDPSRQRERSYDLGDSLLADFLGLFDRYEVRLTNRLQDQARRLMARHNLKPMDACLLASALYTNVKDIVSLDNDFRRVDDIDLWNDFTPSKRRALRSRRR